MLDFSNRRVLVTGAAGGVGTALCSAFAEYGAHVIALDIDEAGLSRLDAAETHVVDLVDESATADAMGNILAAGPLDVLVANLGWTRAETLEMVTDESIGREIEINLTAAIRLTRLTLPALREARGAMVFISSVNARAHFGNPVYSAAKAGVEAWMRAIATEEGRHGVRANAVVPASVRTPAWDHRAAADPTVFEAVSKLYPLGRMVEPREVADAAAFLASSRASGITGTTLSVDCGLTGSNLSFLRAIAQDA